MRNLAAQRSELEAVQNQLASSLTFVKDSLEVRRGGDENEASGDETDQEGHEPR